MKLVVSPLAAVAMVALLGLSGSPADVVVLQAAMPAAVFTSLIALEHDLEADFVTSVVLASTLISALTLPVVIRLLRPLRRSLVDCNPPVGRGSRRII